MNGKETIYFKNHPKILGAGSIVGKYESDGPLAEYFDKCIEDGRNGEDTWEQAESKFHNIALGFALGKANLGMSDLQCILSGDLLNQCVASSFAWRDMGVPFLGLYGACSTFAEGLTIASMLVDSDHLDNAAVSVSSHFCTAERQYRNPLAYGSQRPPTAQRTVTGAGSVIVAKGCEKHPQTVCATLGAVVDSGINDANNMGAAMAPAAYETLKKHFENTNAKPSDFDLIATGDLGEVGRKILIEFFSRDGVELGDNYIDCGCEMFDIHRQDVHSGASGCACLATVFSGYIMSGLLSKKWNRILIAGTGSLQSPLTIQQKETIPGVCHAVEIISGE
ncbi:MAG: stage V sporulation protein AD [Oscillospiraceae bacterium]|nr:stage V sporulation protein AD [Oscillospiraceae bacterium]